MERTDNYAIQAAQARARFLRYDQEALIKKLNMRVTEAYFQLPMLSTPYRICRATGDIQRLEEGTWVEANSFEEVMTLLDLVCDCRSGRFLSGQMKSMNSFGLMFHQNLLEDARDPWAERFQADPGGFRRACAALGGRPVTAGDIAYSIELFDGLCITLQLWLGDEEFPPNLRILWDANANLYIRYETMYFAKGLLFRRLREEMEKET